MFRQLATWIFWAACCIGVCVTYEYETRFFKQQVDHFGYTNEDYFYQRYLISDKYWDLDNGPIFFYTGNEGNIIMFANNTGFMWEHAPKFHALLIFAEHRYYGLTMPYGNKSFDNVHNRGFLTSEQALADFATLIYNLKETLPRAKRSPVIAFGGSYGGMLAAWLRMKYPHIVNGALASSAPILQFGDLTPCGKFAEIITNGFGLHGDQCVESIRRSWKIIRKMGNTTYGAKWLSSNFKLCDNLEVGDSQLLVNWLQDTWGNVAMTNYPYPTDFLAPLPAHPVAEMCRYLKDAHEPDEHLLFDIYKAVSVYQNYTGAAKCFNLSASSSKDLGLEGWSYQSCTEMIMPMCQDGIHDMFEPSAWILDNVIKQCDAQYHVKADPNKAIIMYGGRNISAASNIIFSNGKLDPWSGGGVLQSISKTVVAYFMDDAAHHLDLRCSNPADPPSVVKTRALELLWIKKWLHENKT